MIVLIDNYDSFTYNVVHLVAGLGRQVEVFRNDALSAADVIALEPEAVILSPGPCTPDEAGICLDLVSAAAETRIPLFGICLGLQSIAQGFGGRIVRAARLMHGKVSQVHHDGSDHFTGIGDPFAATRYHSLVAEPHSLPGCLVKTAWSADDGEIMGLAHETLPIAALQFHPESIASQHGARLMQNFFAWSDARRPA